MAPRVLQSSILLCLLAGGALAQGLAPPPTDLLGPRRSGVAAPELPAIEPKAPPQPRIAAPAPPAAATQLSTAPIFVLRQVRFQGNTVLDQPSLDAVAAPFVGKKVSIADL